MLWGKNPQPSNTVETVRPDQTTYMWAVEFSFAKPSDPNDLGFTLVLGTIVGELALSSLEP